MLLYYQCQNTKYLQLKMHVVNTPEFLFSFFCFTFTEVSRQKKISKKFYFYRKYSIYYYGNVVYIRGANR